MALNFQDVPLPFVDTQTARADEPLIQPPGLVEIRNGEFGEKDNVRVVDGFTTVALTSMTGETAIDETLPTVRRLLSHKDELLLETAAGVYRQQLGGSFALAAASSNRKRESLRAQRVSVTSIADAQGTQADDWNQNRRPNAGMLGMDAATLGDYVCTVWCEQYGTAATYKQVSWQIRHRTSDALVGRGRLRDNTTNLVVEPRVVVLNGQFAIYAVASGDMAYKYIDPASTQNVTETMTKFTATGAVLWFDIAFGAGQMGISWVSSTPSITTAIYNTAAPTVLLGAATYALGGAPVCVSNMFVSTGGLGVGNAFIAFYVQVGTGTTLRWAGINTAGVGIAPAAQLLTPGIVRVNCLKGFTGSAANMPVLLDAIGAGSSWSYITCVRYDGTTGASGAMASAGTDTAVMLDHIMFSRPQAVLGSSADYSGVETRGLWLGMYYGPGITFQVYDIAKTITDILAGAATPDAPRFSLLRVFDAGEYYTSAVSLGFATVNRFCGIPLLPSNDRSAYVYCGKFTPNITNATNLGQNPTNIQRNELSLIEPSAGAATDIGDIEFADLLYMAGGCPLVYDGQDIVEEGFTYAPVINSVTPAGGAGPLSAGSYQLVLVYEWYDGQGNRWQSAPSAPYTFVAVAGNTYTVSALSLQGSLKSGVQIVPYRTTANGTIFRRDSPLGVTPLTDAAIASCEALYTGGVVTRLGSQSNNALPGVKQFAVHQNRLFAVGGEFERGFFYSKERSPRFPGEFNRASGFGMVPEVSGRLASAASVDDKLVLFGEDGLAVVFGQGPNFDWSQNGYSTPAPIQSAEGIRFDTPQVALVPDGVWYVTSAGARLLTRGLTTAKAEDGLDLGADVYSTPIGRCDSVIVHPSRPQVFFHTQGRTFIYDWGRNRWSNRVDLKGLDGLGFGALNLRVTRGKVNFISKDDRANKPLGTIAASAFDNVPLTPLMLETGWMSLAGVQKFQRMTHLQVLGNQGSKATGGEYTIKLEVYTDYDALTATQTSTLNFLPGASNTLWQVEFQLVRQQSAAYKFRITVTPLEEGGNFSLVSMLARVGLKKGGSKLSSSQRG